MNSSKEFLALSAMNKPIQPNVGDMWLCKRLGIVLVYNSHEGRRGRRKQNSLNSFHLYHCGKKSLYARPADWRDCDGNASSLSPFNCKDEHWKFVGNIFDFVPYELLAGARWVSSNGLMKG